VGIFLIINFKHNRGSIQPGGVCTLQGCLVNVGVLRQQQINTRSKHKAEKRACMRTRETWERERQKEREKVIIAFAHLTNTTRSVFIRARDRLNREKPPIVGCDPEASYFPPGEKKRETGRERERERAYQRPHTPMTSHFMMTSLASGPPDTAMAPFIKDAQELKPPSHGEHVVVDG